MITSVETDRNLSKYASPIRQKCCNGSNKTEFNAIKYAPKQLLSDKSFMLMTIEKDWNLSRYASDDLLSYKKVVLTAVKTNSILLEYAQGRSNQDKDWLVAADLWDKDYKINNKK